MKHLFTRPLRNRYFLIADLLLLPVAGYLSYVLRLETFDWSTYGAGFLLLVGLACLLVPIIFRWAGVYSRYWRYASVEELLLLAGSVTLAVLLAGGLSLIAVQLLPSRPPPPRSIPFIFLLLALGATAGPRFAVRLTARSTLRQRANGSEKLQSPQPILIMGAGDAGAMIVHELQQNPQLGLDPVGFLDDDLGKHDVRIHGVPVLGDRHAIPEMAAGYKVKLVIIAMPTASGKTICEIVDICVAAGLQTKIVPGLYELLGGAVSVAQLREVRIEDLLRRAPVQTDVAAVAGLLAGKRVLVTGGGGSIGSELCRQILACRPARLVVLGHGENSIFEITEELKPQAAALGVQLVPVIAGIRFPDRLAAVFAGQQPEIIFHAAAHKHVPLMESNPCEAITNNVLGTRNLLAAAEAAGVERFVMISTDKAVNPTSIMGASKRAAELLVHATAMRTGRPYGAVRFGNVLGSRGSVVLTFRKQIAAGGPVTVTHPEMKRYFMTIPEAVQLVLQAAVLGRGGEVFVLDMGEPVKIADLAHDLVTLSGLRPHVSGGAGAQGSGGEDWDIEIVYTGLRPGEKLFEELFISGEVYGRTEHQKIFVANNGTGGGAPPAGQGSAFGGAGERGGRGAEGQGSAFGGAEERRSGGDIFAANVDALIAAAGRDDAGEVRRLLQVVVPEYCGTG